MGNSIEIFRNDQFGEIRTVINKLGEPMFCLPDVCKMLDLDNPSQTKTRLNPKGVEIINLNTLTTNEGVCISELGNRNCSFINEANLYKCIFQSRKPDAEKFQDWVVEEILPSIRKHGGYLTPAKIEEALLDPDVLIQLATTLKEERQKRIEAEKNLKIKTEALDESNDWYTIKRRAFSKGVNWHVYNWRALKRLSTCLGKEVKKAFDANYGEVNLYHLSVFEAYERSAKIN